MFRSRGKFMNQASWSANPGLKLQRSLAYLKSASGLTLRPRHFRIIAKRTASVAGRLNFPPNDRWNSRQPRWWSL